MDVDFEETSAGWFWWFLDQEDSRFGPHTSYETMMEEARQQCMVIEEGLRWDAYDNR